MKKLILVLVVLALAAPALAGDPTVKAAQVGDTNVVVITYDVNETPDGNLFRAFALTISVTAGTIGTPYDVDPNYYIYPGSIVINGGDVSDYGTPVAAQTSSSVTLEMGSLYASNDPCGHTTAPPKSGVVCRVIVSDTSTVELEVDSTRGGVVMEDTEGTFNVQTINGDVELGPVCWGYTYQCRGDIDNIGSNCDIDDFFLFAASFGYSLGQPSYNECANLDHLGDNCDIDDFFIFAAGFGNVLTPCP
jgi:hypothetical protein